MWFEGAVHPYTPFHQPSGLNPAVDIANYDDAHICSKLRRHFAQEIQPFVLAKSAYDTDRERTSRRNDRAVNRGYV